MKRQKGFTLIELLVVIAIIGILSAVVLTSLNSARQKARDSERISDIKQIASAMELTLNVADEIFQNSINTPTAIGTALPVVPTNNYDDGGTSGTTTYGWLNNTGTSSMFCTWTSLENGTSGRVFLASEKNSGYRASAPTTFVDCKAE